MRIKNGRGEVEEYGPTDARRGDPRKSERQKQEDQRNRNLLSKFGLTPDQYQTMLDRQGGVCAICRLPEKVMRRGRVRRLAVDHDHLTGTVRGLLCASCNATLGFLRDDPVWAGQFVERMSTYITQSTATAR